MQNNMMVNTKAENQFRLKVLFVEDDKFTQHTISELLENQGVHLMTVDSAPQAIRALTEFDPNVILTDLDLGTEPDGGDLLRYVSKHHPWIGKVILTAHSSPEIALGGSNRLPEDVTFLIKSLVSSQMIYEAIVNSVEASRAPQNMSAETQDGTFVVSKSQGELLRMMADGLSNIAIAEKREITLTATKSVIHRLFASLGLDSDSNINQRVMAVKLWQQGKVRIK